MVDLLKELQKEDPLIREYANQVFDLIWNNHEKNQFFPLEFRLNEEIKGTSDPTSSYHFIKFVYKNAKGNGEVLHEKDLTLDDKDAVASSYIENIIKLLEKYYKYAFDILRINIERSDNNITFKAQKIIKV